MKCAKRCTPGSIATAFAVRPSKNFRTRCNVAACTSLGRPRPGPPPSFALVVAVKRSTSACYRATARHGRSPSIATDYPRSSLRFGVRLAVARISSSGGARSSGAKPRTVGLPAAAPVSEHHFRRKRAPLGEKFVLVEPEPRTSPSCR